MRIDAGIVEAAGRGDPAAFEALVRETHRSVYGLVYRLVANHEDAADVMQEVYVRVWRSLRRFRGESSFETWIYRVATNAALSHLKRRRRDPEPIDPHAMAEVEPAAGTEVADRAELLERALAALPMQARTAVVMRDVYGFSIAEIAKQIGATEGAVKVRLFRARKRLADRLEADGVVVPIRRKSS